MDIGKQIRNYRGLKNLSQERLAEKIYVSRQTISNWETDKTYPDIHSLLLMATLFDVTLDDLVKGDVEMMKKTIAANRMTTWAWAMIGSLLLAIVGLTVGLKFFGWPAWIIFVLLWGFAMFAAFKIRSIQNSYDVKTYSEILAFMGGEEPSEERVARERKHLTRTRILYLIGSIVIGAAVGMGLYLLVY